MKATIHNIEVEGTPQEIAEFVKEFETTWTEPPQTVPWYVGDPLPNGSSTNPYPYHISGGSTTYKIGH